MSKQESPSQGMYMSEDLIKAGIKARRVPREEHIDTIMANIVSSLMGDQSTFPGNYDQSKDFMGEAENNGVLSFIRTGKPDLLVAYSILESTRTKYPFLDLPYKGTIQLNYQYIQEALESWVE